VSHRIGQRLWRSSSQPNPLETYEQVVENHSWKYNKHNWKTKKNTEHGEENYKWKEHAYVHEGIDLVSFWDN